MSNTIPAFVVVNTFGEPEAFEDQDAALKAFLDESNRSDIVPGLRDAALAALASRGEYRFFHHDKGGSRPVLCSIHRGKRPLSAYVNAHVGDRPKMVKYLSEAATARAMRAGLHEGDIVETAMGEVFRVGRVHEDRTVALARPDDVSFFIDRRGFSGSSGMFTGNHPIDALTHSGTTRWAPFWMFLDAEVGPHRRVDVQFRARVWRM